MKIKVNKVGLGWDLPKFREYVRSLTADGEETTVTCGYMAHYAVYQHENLQYQHLPGRRARWFALAVREERPNITLLAREVIRETVRTLPALLAVARFLLDAANHTVPLDTSFLEQSTFIRTGR